LKSVDNKTRDKLNKALKQLARLEVDIVPLNGYKNRYQIANKPAQSFSGFEDKKSIFNNFCSDLTNTGICIILSLAQPEKDMFIMKRISMKWASGFVLTAFVLIPSYAYAAEAIFPDVPFNHWACGDITRAYKNGWIRGMADGNYAPSKALTNAEFTTMLTGLFFPDELDAEMPEGFPWYAVSWNAAQKHSIHNGTDVLSMNDMPRNIIRYDMAQMVANTMEENGITVPSGSAPAFQSLIKDWDSIPERYREAVAAAYALGILNGKNGFFSGSDDMTRAEAAAVLCRINDVAEQHMGETDSSDMHSPSEEKGILFFSPVITLAPGNRMLLNVYDSNYRAIQTGVSWTVETPELFWFNSTGRTIYAGQTSGTGYLTASFNGYTARLTVRVIPYSEQINLSRTAIRMEVGNSSGTQLMTFNDSKFNGLDYSVSWGIDDPSIAGLKETGSAVVINALSPGVARITCTVSAPDGSRAEEYCFVHVYN